MTLSELTTRLRQDFSLNMKDDKILALISELEERLFENEGTENKESLSRKLKISGGYIDIYIYYILSKEALFLNDSERFEKFNTLFEKALCEFILKNFKANTAKIKNIW